jgi:uncharacterized membrane protein YjdF
MNTAIIVLIILFALAAAYVLVRGIMTMAQGKDFSGEQSNRFMTLRVLFQMLAIAAVILLLVVSGRGAGS